MTRRLIGSSVFGLILAYSGIAFAQTTLPQPIILVIMGDDIGWENLGAYHQGLMLDATPNLDKLATDGMRFADYYAEASCTAGRATMECN
jgi:arylsulfatase A-like enzyme